MAVRIVLELQVEGDGETERSIRESAAWANAQGAYSSAFHEVVAHLAMVKARQSWVLAETYRQLEQQRAQRKAKAEARRKEKSGG